MEHILKISLTTFIIFLNGCSITTPFFSTRPMNPLFIADIPPNRVTIAGKYDDKDLVFIQKLINKMLDKPYKNHSYKHQQGVSIGYNVNHLQSVEYSSGSADNAK